MAITSFLRAVNSRGHCNYCIGQFCIFSFDRGRCDVWCGLSGIQGPTGVQGFGVYALLSSATTLTETVQAVACDSSGGGFTLDLPLAATAGAGKEYIIFDQAGAAQANNITIARSGADTINGQTSYLMDSNYELVKLYSSGAAYYLRAVKGTTGLQGVTGLFGPDGATGIQGTTGV